MTAKVGVNRDEGGLKEALDAIHDLEEDLGQAEVKNSHLSSDQDVIDYFEARNMEARNMLEFSKLVMISALLCEES